MADMGAQELQRWRTRLQNARDLWVERGFIGTQRPSTMRMLLDFYSGEQWKTQEGAFWDEYRSLYGDVLTVNKVYSTVNTSIANLGARDPEPQLFPRTPEAQQAVPFVEALLAYDMEEQNMRRQWNLALRDHHFAPLGIVRHGFTPQEEFFDQDNRLLNRYRPARPDRPWIKAMRMWDVLLDTRNELHNDGSMRWCAFRDLVSMEDIEKNPNLIKRRGLKPNVDSRLREMRDPDLRRATREDDDGLVELWTVYEVDERTWFTITLDDDVVRPIRDREDWPIPWEWLPLDLFAVHEQMVDPFPKPLIEEIVPIQMELNRLRTIMSLIARNTRRIIGVSDALEESEREKLEDTAVVEIIRTGAGSAQEAIQQIAAGGFPQELLQYEELLNRDLREIKGQSRFRRAQRENVESATEAQFIQQGDDVLLSDEQVSFEEFMTSSVRNYFQARAHTMVGPETIPVLGVPGALGIAPFLEVAPEELREDYFFKIRTGSTLPDDRDREARQALADAQVAASAPDLHNVREVFREYWLKRRKDPQRFMVQEQQAAQADEARGAQQQAGEQDTPVIDPQAFQAFGGGIQ